MTDTQARTDVDGELITDVQHALAAAGDVCFTWDYERARPQLAKLYSKAKRSQWDAETDLDWSIDVDLDEQATFGESLINRFKAISEMPGSPLAHFGAKEWKELSLESQRFQLSQFLHGEQGALLVTGKIVEQVPWIDAKYYAATQVMDEARHVEVFARYLDEKLGGTYPINRNLQSLLDDIITDHRWDMTYLGMQVIVEGLALAAFGFLHMVTPEPLLKQLLRYVMSDEARHVAFGVLSLKEAYDTMSAAELKDRQEFCYEACRLMVERGFQGGMWTRMGVDGKEVRRLFLETRPAEQKMFQAGLFTKIVPNVKKLGLLDAGDGWLRDRFTEMDIIQYEDWVDTSMEYEALDEVSKDRAAAS